MSENKSGSSNQPSSGCNEEEEDGDCLETVEVLSLIGQANSDDEELAKQARTQLWNKVEDELRFILSMKLKVSPNCDRDVSNSADEKVEEFIDGLGHGFDLLLEAIHSELTERYTGKTSTGRPVSFVQHMKTHFRWRLNEKWHEKSHPGITQRTWNRFRDIVKEAHPHGIFDLSALNEARSRVLAGEYHGVISIEAFDQCWQDQSPLSLDAEIWPDGSDGSGEPTTLGEQLVSTIHDLQETTPVGQVAQDAFDKLGPRQQEQFARAKGLWGEKETNVAIADSLPITPQGVSYNVVAVTRVLEAAVDDYLFDNGQPRYKP